MTEAPAAPQQTDDAGRIAAYVGRLAHLRERSALREVAERELLTELILQNQPRIREFPLLETQQQSVVNLLCLRSADQPGHESFRRLLAGFTVLVTQYSKAQAAGESGEMQALFGHLKNTEQLLLKLVQGVIFTLSLIHDNFEELFITAFGERAAASIGELSKASEMGETFWRNLFEMFLTSHVKKAFEAILAEERYQLVKDGSGLALRIPFDQVLSRLTPPDKGLAKTRIQAMFAEQLAEPGCAEIQRLVLEALRADEALLKATGRETLLSVARIACMDPSGRQLAAAEAELKSLATTNAATGEAATALMRRDFARELTAALATGALLAVLTVREEIAAALSHFGARETELVKGALQTMEQPALERTLPLLLELELISLLKDRAAPEGAKVQIRAVRTRRARAEEVEALSPLGLSKIRRNRLFDRPAADGPWLLFKPRSGAELAQLLSVLQIEEPLAGMVMVFFERAGFQVEITAFLNLELIAKTTTNLKKRLSEILAGFGIAKG